MMPVTSVRGRRRQRRAFPLLVIPAFFVIPARAGIQGSLGDCGRCGLFFEENWIPARGGMTNQGWGQCQNPNRCQNPFVTKINFGTGVAGRESSTGKSASTASETWSGVTSGPLDSSREGADLVLAMITPGPDDKVYPPVKIATVLDALAAEGVSPDDALVGVSISKDAVGSPATRVSINQVIACYRNADRLTRDPRFAYHTGLRFHVSTYGMYGFAILSSTNFRQTMNFAVKYGSLATPVDEIYFKEQGDRGIWRLTPFPLPSIDARLYKLIVEMGFGVITSLHRDVMGASFAPSEIHVSYRAPPDAAEYPHVFGCEVRFGQPENLLLFDSAWLDRTPTLGNEIAYSATVELCDSLVDEFRLKSGLVGKVRQALMVNLMRPTSFDAVAKYLNMSSRTLRRRLQEEDTSFRALIDELRRDMAIKYLRDTDLTVEDIANSLGFSDGANFRHAFRRWTNVAPQQFRQIAGKP